MVIDTFGYALVFMLISRRGRFTRWLYGYPGGLAEVDPDGRPRALHPIDGKPRKYDDHRDGSGYAVLCRLLLALGANASYEARG